MKIILIKDSKAGKANTIVDVSDGYGKNFLTKQGYGVVATKQNIAKMNSSIKRHKANQDASIEKAKKLKSKLEKLELSFTLKMTNMVVHGSITTKQINKEISARGIELPKYALESVHITSLGVTKIPVKLHKEVTALLSVRVGKNV